MARIGFVGNFFLDKVKWLSGTGKKILETNNELAFEMNQRHEDAKTLDAQARAKKEFEKRLSGFTNDIVFSLHVPWEPSERYDLLTPGADVSDIIEWIRFAAKIGAATINMHMSGDEGVDVGAWKKTQQNGKDYYLDIVGNNLQGIVAECEKRGVRLTLEALMTNYFVESAGRYRIFYAGNFPGDFEYVRKKFGYKFGVTPDVCHLVMDWINTQKKIDYGFYPEDALWKNYKSLPEFLSAWLNKANPIYEAHISDCAGLRHPSQHGIVLGDGLLGDEGLKAVIGALP
ncbi:MAG: hypothetical protein V1731_03540, partial [Candidatus Aenigmatarchaeota archaeon]